MTYSSPARRRGLPPLAACLLWCCGLFLSGASAAATDKLVFEDCELSGSAGHGRASAECATWLRPLDPANPTAGDISLFVARIKSSAPTPATDAVTLINGGPGAASTELYVDMADALAPLRRDRDIILVDQRGTGRSSSLQCEDPTQQPNSATADEFAFESPAAMRWFGATCRAQLPFDPAFFTTSIAVQDLEALRIAAGYEQLNLYGVSYGTRVAQHYARRYPDAVRTLTIDGVLPPPLAMGPMVPLNAQRALDSIIARCSADQACHAAFPNLAEDFVRLSKELKQQTVTVTVADPYRGQQREVTLGYAHLAITIRLMAYATETSSLIPLIISEAANAGNFVPIATQALQMETQLGATMSYGMHFAVVCTEDVPFLSMTEAEQIAVATTYLGLEQVSSLQEVCANWPQGTADSNIKDPWQSDLPTLILSGEFDPITIHEYGTEVARSLSNHNHVIVPGHGHGVLTRGCVPQIFSNFVDTAAPAELDASCVNRLGPEPFFIDLMGPSR